MTRPQLYAIYGLVVIQQCFASSVHIVARNVVTHLDASFVVLVRSGLAALIFLIFLLFRRKHTPVRFDRHDVPIWLLLGLTNVVGSQWLFATGLKYTIPPNAALAYAMTPAFVLIIAIVVFRHQFTLPKLWGIALAFLGVLLVLFEKGLDFKSDYFIGNVIEFWAAFSWAVYSIVGQKMALKYDALSSATVGMISGLLLYVPLYLAGEFLGLVHVEYTAVSMSDWLQLAYMAAFATCASFFLWFYAMTKLEAGKVAVFMNLQPVLTTLFTIIIWGTVPSTMFFVGGAIVIVGVWLTQRGARVINPEIVDKREWVRENG